jgi:hypothetical protein
MLELKGLLVNIFKLFIALFHISILKIRFKHYIYIYEKNHELSCVVDSNSDSYSNIKRSKVILNIFEIFTDANMEKELFLSDLIDGLYRVVK